MSTKYPSPPTMTVAERIDFQADLSNRGAPRVNPKVREESISLCGNVSGAGDEIWTQVA